MPRERGSSFKLSPAHTWSLYVKASRRFLVRVTRDNETKLKVLMDWSLSIGNRTFDCFVHTFCIVINLGSRRASHIICHWLSDVICVC